MKRSAWLPFGNGDEALVRLLCLPHAGAGAAAYRAWGGGLDARIAVCPLQPPGRGKRRDEAPFTSARDLVKSLVDEIAANVREPFALFGHSTGALCAFEAARELQRIGAPQPLHLFVSGRRAPQIPMGRHKIEAMDHPELAEFLRRLGGTPEEVLSDQAMLGSLRTIIAADFQVNEVYEYADRSPLDTRITAFAGTRDDGADPVLMARWAGQTRGEFSLHRLNGGHFAVFERRRHAHSVIARGLVPSPG